MSTDFSLDALLNGSSVTFPMISKQSLPSTPSVLSPSNDAASLAVATATQLLSTISATIPKPASTKTQTEPSGGEKKKRSNKRKREDEDDDHKNAQQKDSSEPSQKKKRVRTAYTRQQLQRLEYMFAQNQYPDMLMRENIAEELGLPDQKIHVWFQNRRAKQRRLRGQPSTPFPSPTVCTSILQCSPTSLSGSLPVGAAPASVYYYHQQPTTTSQSVGVQTYPTARSLQQIRQPQLAKSTHSRPPPLSLPPHTRPLPLTMQSCSPSFCLPNHPSSLGVLTPSPSPSPVDFAGSCSSTPSPHVSPDHLQVSPTTAGGVIPAVYPSPYSFMLPPTTRTSPVDGQRVTFSSPFPYYHPQKTSSSSQPPMYFLDMTPPLSGNRVNSVIPAFPHLYKSQ